MSLQILVCMQNTYTDSCYLRPRLCRIQTNSSYLVDVGEKSEEMREEEEEEDGLSGAAVFFIGVLVTIILFGLCVFASRVLAEVYEIYFLENMIKAVLGMMGFNRLQNRYYH